MRLIGSALVGLFVLATAGVAAGQSNGASGQQAGATKTGEPMICRRVQETGSLGRGRRVCHTRAEWDRLAQTQRENSPGMTAFSGGSNGN
jgi:hypothetical protein